MSETAGNTLPTVTPRLVVSTAADEAANKAGQRSLASRRRTLGPRPVDKQHGRSASSEWIDVDESPPRRRRSSKRSGHHGERPPRDSQEHRSIVSEVGGFFPRLSRILEGTESTISSRATVRSSDTRRHRESTGTKRQRHHDDANSVYKRPVRHRNAAPRRNESLLKINPSLLSVLSSLTGTSDRSSGSGSTVTQRSYNRRGSDSSKTPTGRPRRYGSEERSIFSSRSRPMSPNVFDYMVSSRAPSTIDEGHDDKSVVSSSSSSHYEPSLAGSSEAPDTPSSRSTFPSLTPTNTRSQSVAELRRKYDPQYATSDGSMRSDSHSPDPSIRSAREQPSVTDVAENDEESVGEPTARSELSYDTRQRSSSRSSRSSQRSHARLQKQEDSMRQHMAYASQTQQNHYVDPVYGQHRSPSASSAQSDQAAYAYHMAMQQYQWPSPPAAVPQAASPPMVNGNVVDPERPPAPDAPDLTHHTVAGYEMLALELSSAASPVKPLYRKFEYLNHRILLHLQDELCELEEQLRLADEIIAQMDPALSEGHRTPASRRGEAYSSSEIHHRRTSLLGRIFLKTEQYNRAMSSYATMTKSSGSPEAEQVHAYQQWMCEHAPVHEVEARFLHRSEDLIVPGMTAGPAPEQQPKHAALAYLPVALMLPLLLFSIIPTLAGRLAVTALIAVGAFIVAATTRIRHLMPPREWAVCGAAYVLLMSAIAGCVPQHVT